MARLPAWEALLVAVSCHCAAGLATAERGGLANAGPGNAMMLSSGGGRHDPSFLGFALPPGQPMPGLTRHAWQQGLKGIGVARRLNVAPMAGRLGAGRKRSHGPCTMTAGGGMSSRGGMSWESDSGEGDSFRVDDDAWEKLSKVYVLLFNPRTDTEGIYTLQIKRRDGRLINTIVMFEETEDAERYSGLLEAQDFPPPCVEVIQPSEIKDFALGAGYQTTFIPKGTLFMPPETNVKIEDREWVGDQKQISMGHGNEVLGLPEGNQELDAVRMKLEKLYGGSSGLA